MAALFFREMRWDPSDPATRNVDQFVLSKGHAAAILWAALSEARAISEDPLSLRRIDSTLEGHPTSISPWIKVATGSLGQGIAAAKGLATANRLDGIDDRIYCLMGDGECSEGAVWEAAQFASLNRLTNLIAIIDVNGLGQSEAAPYHHDTGVFAHRFAAFGWRTIEIDGHDMAAIIDALHQSPKGDRLTPPVTGVDCNRLSHWLRLKLTHAPGLNSEIYPYIAESAPPPSAIGRWRRPICARRAARSDPNFAVAAPLYSPGPGTPC